MFIMIVTILLINLLIAMMGNTYGCRAVWLKYRILSISRQMRNIMFQWQVLTGICLDFSEIAAIKNEWMRQWAQTVLVSVFFEVTDINVIIQIDLLIVGGAWHISIGAAQVLPFSYKPSPCLEEDLKIAMNCWIRSRRWIRWCPHKKVCCPWDLFCWKCCP